MKMLPVTVLASALAISSAASLQARTKLVTLPERELLITSLDKATQPLLSEERVIPLQQGTNHIDFSWRDVNIHPESVDLQILGAGDVRIISTGFPKCENALTWEVYSPRDEATRVRVSYLINGISQSTSYELRLGSSETVGEFRQYMLISNQSGEDLDGATIRAPFLGEIDRSLRNGESRRILARSIPAMEVEKLFVSRPAWRQYAGEDGETISMVYEIANTTAQGLGQGLLPAAKIRVFSQPQGESPVFIGEDNLAATAPGESSPTRLGVVRDVVLERHLMRERQFNETFNNNRQPVLFDREMVVRYVVKNFKNEAVTLRIHEAPPVGDWEVASSDASIRLERESVNDLMMEVDIQAAPDGGDEERRLEFTVTYTFKRVFPNDPR